MGRVDGGPRDGGRQIQAIAMNQDRDSPKDVLKREMFTHLSELRDRCDSLIASKYPLDVYNEVHFLRSIVGQIAAAAERFRRM